MVLGHLVDNGVPQFEAFGHFRLYGTYGGIEDGVGRKKRQDRHGTHDGPM